MPCPGTVGWAACHRSFHPPLIFGALAEVVPDRVMAGSGLIDFITLQGRRPDGSGMSTTFCAAGGFGALSDLDGQPTTPGSSNMGGMSAELFEPESGLVVERKTLRPDSGGAGAYRGGPGRRSCCETTAAFRLASSPWPTAPSSRRRASLAGSRERAASISSMARPSRRKDGMSSRRVIA